MMMSDMQRLTLEGMKFNFNTNDPYSKNWFYPRYNNGALHEPVVSRAFLSLGLRGKVFLDVGAHIGYFAVLAAACGAHAFAIEMQPDLIPIIKRNVSVNDNLRVDVINAAVGDKNGLLPVPKGIVGATGAVHLHAHENSVYVPSLRLDDAFASIPGVAAIKIDVEGYEGQVLTGAKEIIARDRPILFVELHESSASYGFRQSDVVRMIRAHGYEAFLIKDHRSVKSDEETPIADFLSFPENTMIVCRPITVP
jgi:FkbM family methyltransferase